MLTASGVAFNDDVVQIAGSPSASVMPEPFSNAPRHRGFRGYETISNSVSPYWNDVPRAVQSLAPFDPRGNHDPNTAPLFAYGPPQFTRIEQEAIVNRQNHFRESDDDMVEARQLEQDMEVYAFPQYRLVYKAELKDGGVVIADASDSDDKRMWRLDPFTPSSLSLRHSYSPDRSTAFGEISRFWRDNFMDSRPFAGIVLDDVRTDALYNIVLESMLRNPVSATTWENPLLLPCKSKEQPGIKDMAAVRDYAMVNCMLGASSPLAPTYFKVSTSATLSPHLQKKKAAAPTPPPRPAASASPQTRLGHGRHTAQKPPARQIPSHLLQSRHSDAARQSLMRRVGGQVDRQRGWQAVTEQKAKAAAEAAKREQQTRAAKGRMLPQERPLADRLGYYKVLGLAVTNDFIDYTMEVAINKRLKDQRNQMIIANHPDYSLSAVEEERRTKRAAEINVAFDHLETCEDRVKYHNAHRR
ncbi:hypothetical protein Q8F55_003013 [Vanrija albida]|uniref:J domain-containing protein n=1 Tax=Vanrija albida TaxID=181172 RepID=A0ABR3QBB3_9TREE